MKSPVATAIAISVGVILLAGYFIVTPILQNLRFVLLDWAIILGGFAVVVGILSLLRTHWRRLRKKNYYSIIFIIAFLLTAIIGLFLGPSNPTFGKVVTKIQVPLEASLLAVLFFILIFAAIRLFEKRQTLMGVLFIISTLLFLFIGSSFLKFGQSIPGIGAIISTIQALPIAGARGILLGMALGGIAAGVRILIGVDRPYRE
jgi:hypothetical protein